MPQSLAAAYCHIVFSTKQREHLISEDIAEQLYPYFGGILRERRCVLLIAGGMPDHVHLLVSLSREITIADTLRDLKTNSSRWIHESFPSRRTFAWQTGYAAFSVSASQLPTVKRYIAQQREHHEKQSFQDEYRQLLDKHGIEYDERYVWD